MTSQNPSGCAGSRSPLEKLPHELLLLIASYLYYGELQKLSRVNRFFRDLVSEDFISACLTAGELRIATALICRCCRRYVRAYHGLVWTDGPLINKPFSAYCVPCAIKTRRLKPGQSRLDAPMNASGDRVHACRWCGRRLPAFKRHEFHVPECLAKFRGAGLAYHILATTRSAIAVATYAVAWRYFSGNRLVLGTTIVSHEWCAASSFFFGTLS